MKRSTSLAAAVSVAVIATGATASSAVSLNGLLDPLLDPLKLPVDLPTLEVRLRALGLDVDQVLEIEKFLTLDRDQQKELLLGQGLIDPGGDLSNPTVADYLLGQYLVTKGDRATGLTLQLSSGLVDAKVAIDLGQSLRPEDIKVSHDEAVQQRIALGKVKKGDERRAIPDADDILRARVQRVATLLRPYLDKLVPNLASVWIDNDKGFQLVVSTAAAPDEVTRALNGLTSFAGIPIEVRTTKLNRSSLNSLAASVKEALNTDGTKLAATIRTNPTDSTVHIVPNDAAAERVVRSNPTVAERVKAGDVVVDPARTLAKSSIVGGHPTVNNYCTWGFAAEFGSDKRLLTAGHCKPDASVPGLGYVWVPTGYVEHKWQGSVDAGNHGTSNTVYNQFDNYVERTGLPDLEITSRTMYNQLDYGDTACHQGRASGHSCGFVTSLFTAPYWVPSSGFFISVHGPTLNDLPGDSGGPWFYGNSAFGIHTGGSNSTGTWDNWGIGVFGSIEFVERDLHATVLTK